ncbi:MAG: preprotein translocase subunit SecE [Microthrixaceae bacterium]|nr:preprotein translocase subunit SecE [Microthrixaceae bacterium]
MQKAGQLNEDGSQKAPTRERKAAPAQSVKSDRAKPAQFVREVRAELRKVTWPTRDEVIRLSIVVLVTLVIFTALVFALDTVFAEFFRSLLSTGRET